MKKEVRGLVLLILPGQPLENVLTGSKQTQLFLVLLFACQVGPGAQVSSRAPEAQPGPGHAPALRSFAAIGTRANGLSAGVKDC